MGKVDLSTAERPTRKRLDGMRHPKAKKFIERFPPAAKRHSFLRRIQFENRVAPVNDKKTEITDPAAITSKLKEMALAMGIDAVGIAEWQPELAFSDAEDLGHQFVIVFAMTMRYDIMADIGPRSQDEVHRVYYSLDDIGVRIAQHIGAYGYSARMQPNNGEFPLPAYGQLSGIGELGKHGSLISMELGSSFRLCAVSTDMPLIADGPQDFGIDEICASCNVCKRFCPGGAIRSEKHTVNGVSRWHVDTPACEPYFYEMFGCKICLMVCPFNGRGHLKENFKPMAKDIREAKDAAGMLKLIEERTELTYEGVYYGDGDTKD